MKRIEQQMSFIIEIDKMKSVLRQTILVDYSKQESDAEHSWHFALMSMILKEYCSSEIDINKVMKMALIHDLIEIYSGDTFAYDSKGYETKELREKTAAEKIFSLLPTEQGQEIKSLWLEFDALESEESKYANAIDRLQPILNNYMTKGSLWQKNGVTSDKVYKRIQIVKQIAPLLWEYFDSLLKDAIAKGYLEK